MIVYVESNFVLEMALEQEQVSSAIALLDLAESEKRTLAFSSFVLGECYECIMCERRVRKERKYFLSRDRRAFGNNDDRDIKAELDTYNCRYIGSFAQGLDAVQRELQ